MGRKRKSEPAFISPRLSPGHPLAGVIEDAYRVFDCPKPDDTGVCKWCCMEPEIERDFFRPEVRDLPLDYLRDWFFAAADPEMPKRTWGYLLPRVLEVLAADEEVSSNGLEVSLSRFPTGDKNRWSAAQWDVLDRFQRGFLYLYAHETEQYLDDALCMFGNAGWPLPDLFAQVAAWPDAFLAGRFWNDWCRYGTPRIWLTAFWEGTGNTAAFEFYTSQALHDRMAALGLGDDTQADLVTKALAVADVIWTNADWSPAARDDPQD